MNKTLRSQRDEVKDRIKDATARRAEAMKERDSAKEKFSGVDFSTPGFASTDDFKAAEQAVLAVGEIDNELDDLRVAETRILQLMSGDPEVERAGSAANPALESVRRGWDAWSLLGAAGQETGYQNAKKLGIFTSRNKFGSLHLGEIASREEAASFLTGRPMAAGGSTTDLPTAAPGIVDSASVGQAIRPDWRGIVQPLLRTFSFLDLLPVGTTDSNVIEYVQVTAIPGCAAPVAEGDLKPEQGLGLEDATAHVRTIAGWIKLLRQALDDTAGLATLIQTLLPWDVRRQIEHQVIAGDGTGQNLDGILHQSGIHHIGTDPTNANDADRLLMAMTLVILSGGNPNFAAVNPITWQNMLLLREDTAGAGSRTGMYLFGGPGTLATPRVWGMALTPSVAIAEDKSLVGDTSGLTLLFREGVNVKTSDSDQDDFIRNRVTVLAEARVALPIWRPASFAVASQS